jgi:hypothetical protein
MSKDYGLALSVELNVLRRHFDGKATFAQTATRMHSMHVQAYVSITVRVRFSFVKPH